MQYHIKKHHKKHSIRFIVFFIFLVLYGIIEDIMAIGLSGVEFNTFVLTISIVIASAFTAIAEITERLYEKEKTNINRAIKKEKKAIKKEERAIKKFEKRM